MQPNRGTIKKIKGITEEFFQKMTIEADVSVELSSEKTFLINIDVDEPQILIGEGGKTLDEIQRLLKVIIKRSIKSEELFFIDLDISNYKKKKYQYLKEMARSVADEVSLSKKEKLLPPMSPAERRIIHMELANRTDVVTESVGEEPERKIAIRPCP